MKPFECLGAGEGRNELTAQTRGGDDGGRVITGESGPGVGLAAHGLGLRVAGGGKVLLFEDAFENVSSCGEAAAWKSDGEVPIQVGRILIRNKTSGHK